jgi:hypothetical protein
VIQFAPQAFGSGFFDLPEFLSTQEMLHRANRGLTFSATTQAKAIPLIVYINAHWHDKLTLDNRIYRP